MKHMVQNRNNLELDIILVLLKKNVHLREIARTLEKPHPTVLRKINKLVEKNILDYKIEGKNKTFFLKDNLKAKNYIYLAETYKLIQLLEKYPKLSIILEEIKNNFLEGMIILFGSYAKGNPKPNSNIDIYLETSNPKIKDKIEGINSRVSVKIGKFEVDSLLIKEIVKNHIIVRGVETFYEKIDIFKRS